MKDIGYIKKFFKAFIWIFTPFLWYIVGVVFIEQLLYWLLLWSAKTFAAHAAYQDIFRFIAGSRYALFPMISGIVMTSFFIRLYRDDWKLRVRKEDGELRFNETEINAGNGLRAAFPVIRGSELGWMLATAAAGCMAITIFINLFREYLSIGAAMEEAAKLQRANLAVLVPATLFVAPVFEELFFRGILFRRARDKMGPVPAALISAFVFGIIHDNAAQFILAFAMGLLFAYVYDSYQSLLPAVLMHASANAASLLCTTELFGGIYEGRGFVLVVIILVSVNILLYGVRKLHTVHSAEYVLFSSLNKEVD